jgi:hypothetical protein
MGIEILGAVGSVLGGLLGNKSSKNSATQTTSNEPWEGVKPYLTNLYSGAANLTQQQMAGMPTVPQLAASMPYAQYFPYQTTTAYNPDPRSLEGLQMQLQYAQNYLPGLVDAQYQSYYDLLNAQNVAQNPYLNQLIGQSVGANTEAFGQNAQRYQQAFGRSLDDVSNALLREWLPSIDSGASLAGQYGGTRQGVAEGVAMGDATKALSRAIGEGMTGLSDYGTNAARSLSSNLANMQMGAWGQGLQAQQDAMRMAPQIAQLGMLPGQIYQGVGSQLDAYRQQQINAEKQAWDYEQNAQIAQMKDAEQRALQNYNLAMTGLQNQWMPLNNMNSIVSGQPFNSTQTSTAQAPGSWMTGAMGGGMLGASLGNMFSSPMQSAYNWATNPGTNVQANPAFTTWGGGLYPTGFM